MAAPPEPRGWSGTLTYTGPGSRLPAPPVEPAYVWEPCATCWSAGRIYLAAERDGRPVAMQVCPDCLGVGSRGAG